MNPAELTEILGDLPHRVHTLYGLEILEGSGSAMPHRLQIGKALRGYCVQLPLTNLAVAGDESTVSFQTPELIVTINKKEYYVECSSL
jgi:hypothetical protein